MRKEILKTPGFHEICEKVGFILLFCSSFIVIKVYKYIKLLYIQTNVFLSLFQDPTLLFAGEAMSHHHFSTTHGAYETGIQAANIILQNEAKKNRTQNDMSSFSVSEYI